MGDYILDGRRNVFCIDDVHTARDIRDRKLDQPSAKSNEDGRISMSGRACTATRRTAHGFSRNSQTKKTVAGSQGYGVKYTT